MSFGRLHGANTPMSAGVAPAPQTGRHGLKVVSFEDARRVVQPVIARSFDPATDSARPRGNLLRRSGPASPPLSRRRDGRSNRATTGTW